MGFKIDLLPAFLLSGCLILAAVWVFARVRSDYRTHGRLTRPVAVLQTGYFFAYAFSSYLFLDSRFNSITSQGFLLVLSIVLMIAGVGIALLSMPFLGRRSFGGEVGSLHTTGIYRYSRNPQLTGSFLFIAGYALLWPSWPGLLWAGIWCVICYLMVGAEEEHLVKVFGREYEEYYARTPRYLGIRRKQ
jgi:protein-S-isoprenylcysteine O-methyltransferase Ste14